tara:strand:- start:630 stop:1229 length:600 start_codon:yes stop_codon:yes gene_type:complete
MLYSVVKISDVDHGLILECVTLHQSGYPQYAFTSRFGKTLLSTYYLEMLKDSQFAFCAVKDGILLGVIFGGIGRMKFVSSFKKRNFLKLAWTFLVNVDLWVPLVKKVVSGWFSPKPKNATGPANQDGRLYNVLVSDSAQGLGVAKTLTEHLIQHLIDVDATSVSLTVDSRNVRAISFYQKMGFVTSVEVGKSVTMVKRL